MALDLSGLKNKKQSSGLNLSGIKKSSIPSYGTLARTTPTTPTINQFKTGTVPIVQKKLSVAQPVIQPKITVAPPMVQPTIRVAEPTNQPKVSVQLTPIEKQLQAIKSIQKSPTAKPQDIIDLGLGMLSQEKVEKIIPKETISQWQKPKEGELSILNKIGRALLPKGFEEYFGLSQPHLTPREDIIKREQNAQAYLRQQRREENISSILAGDTEEYVPPTTFIDKLLESAKHGNYGKNVWSGFIKPSIGIIAEQAGIQINNPQLRDWGEKFADRVLEKEKISESGQSMANIPGVFEGGLKDPRFYPAVMSQVMGFFGAVFGTSVAVTVVTKNPLAGAIAGYGVGGTIESTGAYRNMIDKGVSPEDANIAAQIYGTIATIIENSTGIKPAGGLKQLGIDFAVDATKNKGIKKLFTKWIEEGVLEEGSQQLVENIVTKFIDKNTGIIDNVLESMISGLVGSAPLIGGGAIVNPQIRTEVTKELQQLKADERGFAKIPGVKDEEVNKPFEGYDDLTIKFLEYAKGKTTLSRQEIMDFAKRPELKRGEADLLNRLATDLPEGKIPAQEFADSIRRDLLELKPVKVKEPEYGRITIDSRGEQEGLSPEDFFKPNSGKNYEEVVFESPIRTDGSSHYPNSKNYFAHARGDEVVESGKKIWREQEIQSDLLQKDKLDELKRFAQGEQIPAKDAQFRQSQDRRFLTDAEMFESQLLKDIETKLTPFTNDRYGERIMRERIKEKASKGYESYRFPTGETIGKIEGFQERPWYIEFERKTGDVFPEQQLLKPENLKVGLEVKQTGKSWIITNILGDGRFKAVPKEKIIEYQGTRYHWRNLPEKAKNLLDRASETFDISGKSNPQYKRYEKWGKWLKNNYGAKRITDNQGVSWYEIDLKPEYATEPVLAFKRESVKNAEFDASFEEVYKDLKRFFGGLISKEKIELLDQMIKTKDGEAFGLYEALNDLIQLVRKDGKVQSKTAYHEAFHKFMAFVDPEIRRELLREAGKIIDKTLYDKYYDTYGRSVNIIEEYLADSFADYVADKKTGSIKIDNIFKKILDAIKNWLGILKGVDLIRFYFEGLDTGKYSGITRKNFDNKLEAAGVSFKKVKPSEIKEAIRPSAEKITKRETTLLKDRIRNYARGVRESRKLTKLEIKATQEEVIKILKDSNLDPNDRAKFLSFIKSTQTPQQLADKLEILSDRIKTLEEKAESRKLKIEIKNELKETKVQKVNGKPVGKFTPELQNIFDLMSSALKNTKVEAEEKISNNLKKFQDEFPTLEVALENAVLEMVNSELDVSGLQTLLDSIIEMKESGKAIRELQKFNVQSEYQQNIEHVIDKIGKPTEGFETFGKDRGLRLKLKQSLKSLGKTFLLDWDGKMEILDFNSRVNNKTLRERFNTLNQDNRYKELMSNFIEMFDRAVVDSYGIDKKSVIGRRMAIGRQMNRLAEEINLGKLKNADGVAGEVKMTRDELIKRWMEIQDQTLIESLIEGNKYTDEIFQAIEKEMTDGDKKFAQAQMEMYKALYDVVNPIYQSIYGVSLPKNKFYSPIRREGYKIDATKGVGEFLTELNQRRAITSSSFITRSKNTYPLARQGSVSVLNRHFNELNYFTAWAERIREFRAVFSDTDVMLAIEQNFGQNTNRAIAENLESFTNQGRRNGQLIDNMVNFYRRNFTFGALALKPVMVAKQMTSIFAYMEKLNPMEFTVGVIDFWKSPVKNWRILRDESVFLRTRGRNMDRDVREALVSSAYKQYSKVKSLMNIAMLNITLGDMSAVAPGSWAMRRSALKRGTSLTEAIKEYEDFGNSTQQSSDISKLSNMQTGGAWAQLFTWFKSAPRQYLQKEVIAVKTLFQEGGTSPKNIAKVAKVLFIYHVLLPVLFQYVSNFGGWDDEDKKEYLFASIFGPFDGLFIMGDLINYILRSAMGLRVWDINTPFSDIAEGITKTMSKIDVDDIRPEEFYEAINELLEASSAIGIPYKQVKNMFGGVGDIIDGSVKEGIGRVLGWTEYAVGGKKEKRPKRKSSGLR